MIVTVVLELGTLLCTCDVCTSKYSRKYLYVCVGAIDEDGFVLGNGEGGY